MSATIGPFKKHAELTEAVVTISVITVSNKQMTLAVFRQIQEAEATVSVFVHEKSGTEYTGDFVSEQYETHVKECEQGEVATWPMSWDRWKCAKGLKEKRRWRGDIILWGRVRYECHSEESGRVRDWVVFSEENVLYKCECPFAHNLADGSRDPDSLDHLFIAV